MMLDSKGVKFWKKWKRSDLIIPLSLWDRENSWLVACQFIIGII